MQIEREGFETVGGYLLSHLGRVPAVGERFEIDGLSVEVLDAERRRVNKVRISRREVLEAADEASHVTAMKSGFVSLIGRPNAGKSTLLNRLVGTKLAIVSDKPQTTRTRILGVRNYPDAQVVFLDTPGIHRPLHRMNVRMVDTAVDTIRRGRRARPGGGRHRAAGQGRSVRDRSGEGRRRRPVFLHPQQDRSDQEVEAAADHASSTASWRSLPRSCRCRRRPATTSIGSSARSSIGCRKASRCYPPDYLTDQPERFFAAEIVREKLLQFTHAEIPFSSAVVIDRFEEPEPPSGLLRLYCTIVVDRESQKPIVIGRGGDMIKRIGTAAREELERFFDTRCFSICTSA